MSLVRVGSVGCAVLVALSPLLRAGEEGGLRPQVEAAERAFARTMADRDHEAFVSFLSTEAIFFSGPTVLRGKQEVANHWLAYFEGPEAPFSWEPETVEVLESGSLALSSGPVRGADGSLIATFTSVWRQEEPGIWRIVLDKGNRVCPPPPDSGQGNDEASRKAPKESPGGEPQ